VGGWPGAWSARHDLMAHLRWGHVHPVQLLPDASSMLVDTTGVMLSYGTWDVSAYLHRFMYVSGYFMGSEGAVCVTPTLRPPQKNYVFSPQLPLRG